MSDNPLSGQLTLDTSNYKAGINELNRQIRVIESGFRASAAALGQWDKTATGLEMRNKALSESIGLQQQKVSGLKTVYDQLAAEGKASGKEMEDLQIKINKETETLNKMQVELDQSKTSLDGMGSESKNTGKEVQDFGKKEDDATEKTGRFKAALGGAWSVAKTGAKIVAGLATAVAGVGVGMGKMILDSASAADNLEEMSARTGISTQRLQELAFIGEQVGVDLDTVANANAKIVRSMGQAQSAGSAQAQAFGQLGISIYDTNGQLRDSQDVFNDAIGALGGIENETQRDLVSNALFGKSFQDLNPLIKAGSEELARMTNEANKNGSVMSGEAVSGLANFNDMLAGLKLGLKGTLGELSFALLPGMQSLLDVGGGYLKALVYVVKNSGGDVNKLTAGLGTLIGNIVGDVAKKAPKFMEAGLGVIKGLMDAIIKNLPVILPAVMQVLQALTGFIIQSLPMILDAGLQIVLMLVNGIVNMLPALLEAGIKIIVQLVLGIAQALPQLIPTIVGLIPTIILILIQNLPLLINAALQIVLALANGIVASLPVLIKSLPTLIMALVDALIQALPQIATVGVEILLALVQAIFVSIPLLLEAIPQIINQLVAKFKDPATLASLKDVGRQLVDGLKNGFLAQWEAFKASIGTAFKDLIKWLKGLLGISSPSKVFAGMGINMAAGLGEGFQNEMAKVKRGMNSIAVGGFGFGSALAGAGGQWNSNSELFAFYAPVIINEGEAGSLGKKVKAKKY